MTIATEGHVRRDVLGNTGFLAASHYRDLSVLKVLGLQLRNKSLHEFRLSSLNRTLPRFPHYIRITEFLSKSHTQATSTARSSQQQYNPRTANMNTKPGFWTTPSTWTDDSRDLM